MAHASNRKIVQLAGSYFITICATLAAILLFVALGSQVLPQAFTDGPVPASSNTLGMALVLNIAIILFGWFRSRDLKDAIKAFEEADELAHRNANIDHTTGLANRRQLLRALGDLTRSKGAGVLLLLDVDHFKRVNDLHGHQAGDTLLCMVADAFREASPLGSCCARISGDEFAILLPDTTRDIAEQVARRLIDSFQKPLRVAHLEAQVTASIGLAAVERDCGEEMILRRSDVALYAAKANGRNCLAWFDAKLGSELSERLALEEDIRRGVERSEFIPFFQPLIDLSTNEIVGFEALARWKSPTRGMLEPDSFIETAERTGMIGPLTMRILELAMREALAWPPHLKVAVNISPVQFRDPTMAEQILKVIASTGFPAGRLELEITEAAMLEERQRVRSIIESLRNVGIRIALDDFGNGYASLSRLHDLPVDRIKIDKSFITTLVQNSSASALVGTIARLGHQLNVPMTAEGVESEQIRAQLEGLGCSEAQGWLYGRAVSAKTVASFLRIGGPQAPLQTQTQPRGRMRRYF